jgi:tellurite resistance protein TerC
LSTLSPIITTRVPLTTPDTGDPTELDAPIEPRRCPSGEAPWRPGDAPERRVTLHVTAGAWGATMAAIGALLALDALVVGRRQHAISLHVATLWSLAYIAVALAFGVVFSVLTNWSLGAQYFSGYVVEKSLSVDNLFVFVLIIGSFAVPPAQQPKVISIGIMLALGVRAVFIAIGAAALDAFSIAFLLFGITLIATATQLFRHRNLDPQVDDNAIVALARHVLPLSPGYDGGRIVSRRNGLR